MAHEEGVLEALQTGPADAAPADIARALDLPAPRTDISEEARLEALRRYDILDTAPEQVFDDIVKVAARVCRTPVAAISLVDEARQWFKAEVGINASETPRDISFCTHAIRRGGLVTVPDALLDPLFRENPLVTGPPNVRFYAGAVLETSEGVALGSLCVIDTAPRPNGLSEDQAMVLKALSRQVMVQLDLRRALATAAAATARAEAMAQVREREMEELAASQERLALAMRAGVIGTWNWDFSTQRLYADAELTRAFAISPQSLQAGPSPGAFLAGIHPDDRDWVLDSLRRAVEQGGEFAEEYRIVADGEVRWILARGRCLLSASGKPLRFPGVVIEVTERRRAEEGLREANASRELAMQAAELGRFDHDLSRRSFFWDARAVEMFALRTPPSLEAMLARVHPDDRERVAEGIARATCPERIGAYADEYRVLADDGQVRIISALGRSTFENGECVRFVGVLKDVTDMRRAETLRQSGELRASLAIRAGALGIWEYRPGSEQRIWDDRARELFGWPAGFAVTDHAMRDAIHPADRNLVRLAIEALMESGGGGGAADELEFRTVGADGSLRWVAASGQAVRDTFDKVRLVGTLRDITAQKLAEEHQRLLTNELNHRVKNTLSIVQALVGQTLRSADSAEDARRSVNDRLVVLGRAHDILTRTSWSAAPVGEVVDSATAALGVGADRLRVKGPAQQLAPKVALSLAMAIYELGTNAVKYGALSNAEGHVAIVWRVEPDPQGARFALVG